MKNDILKYLIGLTQATSAALIVAGIISNSSIRAWCFIICFITLFIGLFLVFLKNKDSI